ncbi:hypothetical protein [Paenibacillus xylanexedens]|uniref:hypothetical protein n=1 Tax=Paenibacillus xylanexedens TaxID=528191 RepID=UPI0016425071|nr:hypothetical protein [Paenibacillus xylanexedens]
MSIGWIVGTSLAIIVLLSGLVGLNQAVRRQRKARWPWWLIGFSVAALISAAINYPGT